MFDGSEFGILKSGGGGVLKSSGGNVGGCVISKGYGSLENTSS